MVSTMTSWLGRGWWPWTWSTRSAPAGWRRYDDDYDDDDADDEYDDDNADDDDDDNADDDAGE